MRQSHSLGNATMIGIGLITAEPRAFERLASALAKCGLSCWAAGSAQAYLRDARSARALSIIVDMAGQEGLEALEALRILGVRTPAILIADAHCSLAPDRLARACTLDVLRRPASTPELLSWIACVCAARMVLDKQRARAA